jgi:hypothetical protein
MVALPRNNMALAPEQFASLKKILSHPAAKASAALRLPVSQIENFLRKLEKLVQRGRLVLGQEKLLILYRPTQKNGRPFTESEVEKCLKARTPLLAVGGDETLVSAKRGAVTLVAAAAVSDKERSLCVLCAAGQLWIFAAGKIIAEIGEAPPPISGQGDWRRSWRELRKSFDEHFEHCVEHEKSFRYWADRKKRLLLVGPGKTEKLFHHSLFWWCNSFISDAIDVHGETGGMGQDKTDITIVTQVGSIVVEVKWMGRNKNNKRYAQVRIHEGMLQVADYLNRNKKLMQGFLVMYDARSEIAHQTKSTYPERCRHVRCEEPIIYFLRSETPSEKSERDSLELRKEMPGS